MTAVAAAATAGLLSSWSANAASTLYFRPTASPATWDNSTANWTTTSNGAPSTAWNSADIAQFNDTLFTTTPYTVDLNAPIIAVGLIFAINAGTVDAPSAQTLTIGTSGVTVNTGAAATLGASTSTNLSLSLAPAVTTTFADNGNGLTVNAPISINASGLGTLGSGAGTVTYNGTIGNGSGTLALNVANLGTAVVTNANTYTGATVLSSGGTLVLQNGNAISGSSLNMGQGTVILSSTGGATFANTGITYVGGIPTIIASGGSGVTQTLAGPITGPSGSTTTIFGNANGDSLSIGTFNDPGSSQSLTNYLAGGAVLSIAGIVNGGATASPHGVTISGPGITSVGAMSQTSPATLTFTESATAGVGTVILTASSTYTGATTINAGTLQFANGAGLGATTIAVNAGGALTIAQTASGTSNTLSTAALTLNSGSIFSMHDGFTSVANVTGTASIKAATLVFDIGGTSTASDELSVSGSATLTAGGQIQIDSIGTTALATGAYTLIQGGTGSTLSTNALTLAGTKVYVSGTPYSLSLTNGAGLVQLNVAPFTGTDQAYFNGTDTATWQTDAFDSSPTSGTNIAAPITSGTDVYFSTTPTPAATTSTIDAATTINSLSYLSSASSVTLGGATLTINDGGISDVSTSAQTITAPIVLGAVQTWSNTGSAVLSIGGNGISAGNSPLTLSTTAGGGDIAINSSITSTAGTALNVGGTGTATLFQTVNTFTGQTFVNSGTLALTGSSGTAIAILGGTPITVGGSGASAALQINGNVSIGTTAAGAITLLGGNGSTIGRGTLSLVDGSINKLTLNRTSGTGLTIGGPAAAGEPSVLDFEISSGGADEIVIATGGALTVNPGGALINMTTLSTPANATYTLISQSGGGSTNFSALVFGATGTMQETVGFDKYTLGTQADGASGYDLTLTVTPEPTSGTMLLAGGAAGLLRRRRRTGVEQMSAVYEKV